MNIRACVGVTLALFACASTSQAGVVGYWDFDSYTLGANPAGTPQGGNQGYFDDLSGNDQKAYAAEFTTEDFLPYAPTGGIGGTGAFYSLNTGNNGALAVVQHTDAINFSREDFTISFWEMAKFRDVAGGGWAPGRGRSQFFTKAPYLPNDPENVIDDGFGLNLTQNHFDVLTNRDGDNFAQTSLGARYTYPTGSAADDSGQWAHWAMTGQYNAGTDDYTITVYLNGNAVDWDGATGTTFTVPNDIIDNDGDLTIGSFFRNNGYATQRFISWNMFDTGDEPGEGWMDDFAMWDEVLSSEDLAALAGGSKTPKDWLSTGPQADANGDGVVDAADYVILKQNMGQPTSAGAAEGDFDESGTVNWIDLQIMAAEIGGAAQVIPEPASLGLLALGALALTRRRRS